MEFDEPTAVKLLNGVTLGSITNTKELDEWLQGITWREPQRVKTLNRSGHSALPCAATAGWQMIGKGTYRWTGSRMAILICDSICAIVPVTAVELEVEAPPAAPTLQPQPASA
ncbi:MAG: hypothetical protein HY397_01600 [Candidatus Doudnabacteria bacterium]|nr:hypothetical protein [Candidatus Doudnabacteria bacterium]